MYPVGPSWAGERENPVTTPPPVPSWMLEVQSPPAADLRASPALHRASWAPQTWVKRVVLSSSLFLSRGAVDLKAQPGVGMEWGCSHWTWGVAGNRSQWAAWNPAETHKCPSRPRLPCSSPEPSPTSRQVLPTFPSGLLGWTFATVSNTRSGAGRDVNSNFPRDGQTPSSVFSFPPHPQEISGLGFVICIMGVVADARHGPGSLLTFSLSSLDSLS